MGNRPTNALTTATGEKLTYDAATSKLSDGREAIIVGPGRVNGTAVIPEFVSDEVLELAVDVGDGETTTLFTCIDGCFVADHARSVHTHSSHHGRTYPTGPLYDEEVIRTVLRTIKRHRMMNGSRNVHKDTAAELNVIKIPTVQGKPWTAGAVHHIDKAYSSKYRVHVRRQKNGDDETEIDVTPVSSPPASTSETERVTQMIQVDFPDEPGPRLAAVYESMKIVHADIVSYANRITERVIDLERLMIVASETKSFAVDEEELEDLRTRAARWDQFFALTRDMR